MPPPFPLYLRGGGDPETSRENTLDPRALAARVDRSDRPTQHREGCAGRVAGGTTGALGECCYGDAVRESIARNEHTTRPRKATR